MIYLFKRASSDLDRVMSTFRYELAQAKHEFEMKKASIGTYFSVSCLGLDDIQRDEITQFALATMSISLADGNLELLKRNVENSFSDVRKLIPNSIFELVGLDFDGKKMFDLKNVNAAVYSHSIFKIAAAYKAGDVATAEHLEQELYELVRVSDLNAVVDNKMCDDELLDMAAEYLKKCKDPEAQMIAFLINQAKKA